MRPPSAAQSRAVAVAPAPRGFPGVACPENIARDIGCLLLTHTSIIAERRHIADIALAKRMPAIGFAREFAEDGILISYGASLPAMQHRAATYVDKILKGAKPADLPVEQPTKFELVINRKTAKALGLTIRRRFW